MKNVTTFIVDEKNDGCRFLKNHVDFRGNRICNALLRYMWIEEYVDCCCRSRKAMNAECNGTSCKQNCGNIFATSLRNFLHLLSPG